MPVTLTHRPSIGSIGDSPKSTSFPDINAPQDQQEEEEVKHSAELCTQVYHPHPFPARLHPGGITSLYSGSTFKGHQTSGKLSYAVTVELKHVDLAESSLCGYLHIESLTPDHPKLTTFFDAEMIGSKYPFLTRKWDADESVDRQHWDKFPAFESFKENYNDDDFTHDFKNQDFVFMRWKEHFLVPDHKVKTVQGASFAGFYYICFNVATNSLSGFYYHQNSEWWQQLKLEHVRQPASGSFEFR